MSKTKQHIEERLGIGLLFALLILMLSFSQFNVINFKGIERSELYIYQYLALSIPLLLSIYLLIKRKTYIYFRKHKSLLLLLCFSLICLISCFWSTDAVGTFGHGIRAHPNSPDTSFETRAINFLNVLFRIFGFYLILFAGTFNLINQKKVMCKKTLQRFFNGFVFLLVFSTTFATICTILDPDSYFKMYPNTYFLKIRFHSGQLFGGLDHNTMSFIASILWGLCLNRALLQPPSGTTKRLLLVIVLINCFYLLFITNSKTGWIIFDTSTIYLFARTLFFFKRTKFVIKIAGLFIVFFNLTLPINTPVMNYLNRSTTKSSIKELGGRKYTWPAAYSVILDKPIFGHGWGGLQDKISTRVEKKYPGRKKYYNTPHSSILMISIRTGLFGLSAWFAAIGSLLFIAVKANFLFKQSIIVNEYSVLLSGLIFASIPWGAVGYSFHIRSFCLIAIVPMSVFLIQQFVKPHIPHIKQPPCDGQRG